MFLLECQTQELRKITIFKTTQNANRLVQIIWYKKSVINIDVHVLMEVQWINNMNHLGSCTTFKISPYIEQKHRKMDHSSDSPILPWQFPSGSKEIVCHMFSDLLGILPSISLLISLHWIKIDIFLSPLARNKSTSQAIMVNSSSWNVVSG